MAPRANRREREEARPETPPRKSPFEKSRGIERRYAATLRQIGRQIGVIIDGFPDPLADPASVPRLTDALSRYSDLIGPWAEAVSRRVISELDAQDAKAWARHSRDMSRALRLEIATAPTGAIQRAMLADQVRLIKSLPTEAAQRVHRLTLEGIVQGTRAAEIAKMIQASGEVAKSRATLIARTEVARTASTLTQARAVHVGSEGYIWRTAEDSDVRESHRRMSDRYVEWSNPPTTDGLVGHAGCVPNCRCYPEPVIAD